MEARELDLVQALLAVEAANKRVMDLSRRLAEIVKEKTRIEQALVRSPGTRKLSPGP
jgi:hypothetical protein